MVKTIQIDSREKARAITKIVAEFDKQGVGYYISKLWAGDYMSLDNPRLIIDRKQNLTELCGNLTQQHKRFRDELIRAKEMGIQMIILCEHGGKIRSLEDVKSWINPRRYLYCKRHGIPTRGNIEAEIAEFITHGGAKQPTTGEQLYKSMQTMTERYGVIWEFCDKKDTGKRIIEMLGGE